jgi:hypothetical protein
MLPLVSLMSCSMHVSWLKVQALAWHFRGCNLLLVSRRNMIISISLDLTNSMIDLQEKKNLTEMYNGWIAKWFVAFFIGDIYVFMFFFYIFYICPSGPSTRLGEGGLESPKNLKHSFNLLFFIFYEVDVMRMILQTCNVIDFSIRGNIYLKFWGNLDIFKYKVRN